MVHMIIYTYAWHLLLKLVLLFLGCCHRFHHAQAHLFLFLRNRIVLLLDLFDLSINLLNRGSELINIHLHELFNKSFVLVVAQVQILRTTCWSQILLGKCLQVIVGSTTIVIFQIIWVSVFDAWVASHL